MSEEYPGSERHFTPRAASPRSHKLPVPAMLGYANVYRDEEGETPYGFIDMPVN